MKKLILTILLIALPVVVLADTITNQSFELPADNSEWYFPDESDDGVSDFLIRTNSSISARYNAHIPTNINGTYAIFGRDLDSTPLAQGTNQLYTGLFDASGYSNYQANLLIATPGSDYESNDVIEVYVANSIASNILFASSNRIGWAGGELEGGGSEDIYRFQNTSDTVSSSNFVNFAFDVTNITDFSSVAMGVRFLGFDFSLEQVAIDALKMTGEPPPTTNSVGLLPLHIGGRPIRVIGVQ